MSAAPVITIFVRHSSDCKYAGDEFEKRCRCRKHLRWTHNGQQQRRMAGTRSWSEAEKVKRDLEDQLAGRVVEQKTDGAKPIEDAIETFLTDKKVQGVSTGVLSRYTVELSRFCEFCWTKKVYTVPGITRELLTEYAATWDALYTSSQTRAAVRTRCRGFLEYCSDAGWIGKAPKLPKISVDEPPTLPLTADEYKKLLDALYVVCPLDRKGGTQRSDGLTDAARERLHALLELMRWSGLAIGDAVTLRKECIQYDEAKRLYRIATHRQKTGVSVSVPVPESVALELLKVTNGNPKYVFWSGTGQPNTAGKMWANRYIRPLFEAAGLDNGGRMLSHRLRDTFAVDLLEKGVPLEEVSKLLGHESIKTTEKYYAKWSKGRQDRLDALVTGTWVSPNDKSNCTARSRARRGTSCAPGAAPACRNKG